jgi:hypothetical protein
MEGSMLGRGEGQFPDERSVERELLDTVLSQRGLCYVFTSSQNLDRIVSIYRAVRHSGKILIIDLYTALVLDKLCALSPRIPQFSWRGIRVLYALPPWSEAGRPWTRLCSTEYKKAKIELEEILDEPRTIRSFSPRTAVTFAM